MGETASMLIYLTCIALSISVFINCLVTFALSFIRCFSLEKLCFLLVDSVGEAEIAKRWAEANFTEFERELCTSAIDGGSLDG
jgi:hypothetical protein